MIKKTTTIIIFLLMILSEVNLHAFFSRKMSIEEENRLKFTHKIAHYIEEYYKIKGHYPLADGKYELPLVVYLNDEIRTVETPLLFNNVVVLDYSVLIEELRAELGNKFQFENDDISIYKHPERYISRYYASGNQFYIRQNFASNGPLFNHIRYPDNPININNQSKIDNFKYFPGFLYRYTISSITNTRDYTFSITDIERLQNNNYKFPDKSKKLCKAIFTGNKSKVKKYLNKSPELAPLHEGFNHVSSPLIFAVRSNDFETTKLLLDAGANISDMGTYHDNVLIYALDQKNVNNNLVKLLVDKGANVNQANYFGISPFIGVCLTGNTELVNYFLQYNANIQQDYWGYSNGKFLKSYTPLKAAIKNEHIDIIKLLIKKGALIDTKTLGSEESAIQFAKKLKKENIVKLLKSLKSTQKI